MENNILENIVEISGNPHRFPMLLIDRIIDKQKQVITEKYISLNDIEFSKNNSIVIENFIYPSWLIIESFFQSAGLWIDGQKSKILPYVISCNDIKVKRNIYGGEIIRHYVTLESKKNGLIIVSGISKSDNEIVVSYKQVYIGY